MNNILCDYLAIFSFISQSLVSQKSTYDADMYDLLFLCLNDLDLLGEFGFYSGEKNKLFTSKHQLELNMPVFIMKEYLVRFPFFGCESNTCKFRR